MIENIILLI